METNQKQGTVIAVCKKDTPGLPKLVVDAIDLIENYGVESDYHAGDFVRHRYLARKDPTRSLAIGRMASNWGAPGNRWVLVCRTGTSLRL